MRICYEHFPDLPDGTSIQKIPDSIIPVYECECHRKTAKHRADAVSLDMQEQMERKESAVITENDSVDVVECHREEMSQLKVEKATLEKTVEGQKGLIQQLTVNVGLLQVEKEKQKMRADLMTRRLRATQKELYAHRRAVASEKRKAIKKKLKSGEKWDTAVSNASGLTKTFLDMMKANFGRAPSVSSRILC